MLRWVGIANHINAKWQHGPSDLGKAQRHHASAGPIHHLEGRGEELELLVGIAVVLSRSCLKGRIPRHHTIAATAHGVGQCQLLVQYAIGLNVELFVVQCRVGVVEFLQSRTDGIQPRLAGGDGRVEFCKMT